MIQGKKRTYYLTAERRVLMGFFGLIIDGILIGMYFGEVGVKLGVLSLFFLAFFVGILKNIFRDESELTNPQFVR